MPYESLKAYQIADTWKDFYNIVSYNPGAVTVGELDYKFDHQNLTAVVTYRKKHDLNNYDGLVDVVIPETVDYEGNTYTIVGIDNEAFNYCWGLKSVSIPQTVTFIGDLAFGYCTSLRSVTIPDAVTSIGNEAFTGCSALAETTIGQSVETIGDYAFFGCTGLSEITVPKSVTSIGHNAFMGVHWVNDVHAEAIIPADAPTTAFSATAYKAATLHVPAGTVEVYRAHPTWSKFMNIVEESKPTGIEDITVNTEGEAVGTRGAIEFRGVDASTQVAVFSTSGLTIYVGMPQRVEVGTGLYVVKIGSRVHKVVVR